MLIGWTSIASGGGSNRRKSFSGKGIAAIVVACGLCVGMGCDRQPDQVSKVISDARNALLKANGNGGAGESNEERGRVYAKVISSLQSVSKDATRSGSGAAAKMLMAQAQAGQGEIAAATARRLMSSLVLGVSDARAQLELYHTQRSLGDALTAKPVAADDSLGAELADVEQRLAKKQQDIADGEKRLAELRERAASLGQQAQTTRRSADEGRGDLSTMSAQARAARVTEIAARSREADAIEREQANVLLDAEDAQRRLDGLNRQLVALNDQRSVIIDAQGRIAEMAQMRSTGSDESHARAAATAAEIEKLVDTIKKTLDEELKPALEEAVSKYSSASSSSAQAKQEFQGSALSANYDHAIAGLQLGFAETVEIAVGLIQRLADASPEMPGAEKFRRLVSTLENERKAALEAAGEAYAKASSGFQSAKAQGRTSEVFQSLGEQLARHERRIKGEPEPVAVPEGEEAPVDGEQPAPEPAPETPAAEAPEPTEDSTEPAAEPVPEEPADPAGEPQPEPEPAPEPEPEPAPETPRE